MPAEIVPRIQLWDDGVDTELWVEPEGAHLTMGMRCEDEKLHITLSREVAVQLAEQLRILAASTPVRVVLPRPDEYPDY